MSKIAIFPAARQDARANLDHSVRRGIRLSDLTQSRMLPALTKHAAGGRVHLWGSPTGDRGRKRTVWRGIEPPAQAFFYTGGGFTMAARIWAKEPPGAGDEGNAALAQAVWTDAQFEHIVYLDQVEEIDLSGEDLKAALGYESSYLLGREFFTPAPDREAAVLAAFGGVDAFRNGVLGRGGAAPSPPGAGMLAAILGVTYRREDENKTTSAQDLYRFDPDARDRGTRGHAKTQNALADFLVAHGLEPRSWMMSEAPYDLAWEAAGAIHVAEVKSLTARNEERQLRLALGQVLRYGQELAYKGKPIKRFIVVERAPSDPSWMDLCHSLGVILVWPGNFDAVL
jgi:hypothetical protein